MAKARSGRWWLLLVAIAVVAALVWGFLPQPPEVDVRTVERGSFALVVREDGRTRVRERYVVSSPVAGYLLRVGLRAGDRIERDATPLAALQPADPMLLDARARSEAMARIRAAEALVRQAEASLDRARQASDLASTEYARAQELIGRGAMTQEAFDRIEHQERMARAEVRSAEFAREVAVFEKQQAEAIFVRSGGTLVPEASADGAASESGSAAEGTSRDETETGDDLPAEIGMTAGDERTPLFTIVAPVSGQVLRVLQESAGPVQVGTPLLELGDPSDLEIEIDVLSEDAVRVAPGAEVIVEQWGGDGVLSAIVSRVEPSAFVKVSALGVEEQRVNVIADFREERSRIGALGDGYRIEASIVVDRAEQVLTIPSDALFRDGDAWLVFAIDDGERLRRTEVTIGRSDGLQTELLGGLKEGAKVVSHPSDQLRDGQRIRPRQ